MMGKGWYAPSVCRGGQSGGAVARGGRGGRERYGGIGSNVVPETVTVHVARGERGGRGGGAIP